METGIFKYVLISVVGIVCALHPAAAADLSMDAVNNAEFRSGSLAADARNPVALRAQVLLDRAHVSPGVIDGRLGENTKRALAAYEEMHGFKPDGKLDKDVWQNLTKDPAPALTTYVITEGDVDGPFIDKVPDRIQDMAKLDHLSYTSPVELLAEKFHMDEDLLKALNKDADFGKAGTTITVANVRDEKPNGKVDHVEANKQREALIVYGKDGHVIAYYPASVGSKELPSPSGDVKVEEIVSNPKYYYHPDLDFKGVPDKKFTVAAGPNNPVGSVWIGLSKPHYGIHGTPHPEQVGKSFSHGCVHLTNWDVKEFAKLIHKGTHVIFLKSDKPLPGKQSERKEPPAGGRKQQ
jgi:lipoprotein-anchoring transpeptidase ErfK/SrfK